MVIVDTSVAFKWFASGEENTAKAQTILAAHLNDKNNIIVPDLFFYELANSWATKSALNLKEIKKYLQDLEDIKLKIEPVTLKLIEKAVTFSKKYQVSVYDAIYAVLAEQKGCNLFTADSKFVSRVNLSFVKMLDISI